MILQKTAEKWLAAFGKMTGPALARLRGNAQAKHQSGIDRMRVMLADDCARLTRARWPLACNDNLSLAPARPNLKFEGRSTEAEMRPICPLDNQSSCPIRKERHER